MFGGIRRTDAIRANRLLSYEEAYVLKICHFGLFVKESRAAIETKPE